jgi:hypothetical protein
MPVGKRFPIALGTRRRHATESLARIPNHRQSAEHAHIRGAVRADRHRGVVVVEAEALAGEAFEAGLASVEVEGGEVPGVAEAGVRGLRVGVDEAGAQGDLRDDRRGDLVASPDGLAAAFADVDSLEAGRGRAAELDRGEAAVAVVVLGDQRALGGDQRLVGG